MQLCMIYGIWQLSTGTRLGARRFVLEQVKHKRPGIGNGSGYASGKSNAVLVDFISLCVNASKSGPI